MLFRSGLWPDPPFQEAAFHDVFFVLLNSDWRLVDAQNTGGFARRGTDAARKLREIIRGVELTDGVFPASPIDEIIPVGDEVADGTSGLAERNAAIHAACALFAQLFLRKILIDFEPVIDALGDRASGSQFA